MNEQVKVESIPPPTTPPDKNDKNDKKFLIVGILDIDGYKPSKSHLSALLSKFGTMTSADNSDSAIELLKNNFFDLIILDYENHSSSGLILLEFLTQESIRTPTILLTSSATKEILTQGIEHHIFGLLEKSCTEFELERLVMKALHFKDKKILTDNFRHSELNIGEVMHKISNPLTVLDLQIKEIADQSPGSPSVQRMIRSIDKIKNIIESTKNTIRTQNK